MKKLFTVLTALVLVLSLTGCLKEREEQEEIEVVVLDALPDEQITVTFWHIYGQGKSALLDEMITEFEALYPNITI